MRPTKIASINFVPRMNDLRFSKALTIPPWKFEWSENGILETHFDDHAEGGNPMMCLAAEETIREAKARLVDLLQTQAALRSRILKLRESGQGFRENEESEIPFFATVALENELPTEKSVRPCLVRRSTKLRRACRIALFETEAPETALQIAARITARNSYLFPQGIDAASVIVPELKRLVHQGQAYFTSREGIPCWGWQRTRI
jgi:hypothetical protein